MRDAPTVEFHGWLKRLDFEPLTADERLVIDFALPGFISDGDQLGGEEQLAPIDERVRFVRMMYGGMNRRRYAPGAFLGRGRYYTLVNHAADGDDFGTMRGELNAYRDPVRSGGVHLIDYTNQRDLLSSSIFETDGAGNKRLTYIVGSPNATMKGELVILLYDSDRFIAHIGREKFERLQAAYAGDIEEFFLGNSGAITIDKSRLGVIAPFLALKIRWRIELADIDRVVDLRRRQTQEWFFESFRSGFPPFVSNPYQWGSFADMLPCLMLPRIGGSQMTTAFGLWAMSHGIEAIIYPSARNDVRVIWAGDDVLEHQGWNLVDLRLGVAAPESVCWRQQFDDIRQHKWLTMWLEEQLGWDVPYLAPFIRNITTIHDPKGGFKIEGVSTFNAKLHMDYYVQRRSPWSNSGSPLNAFDKEMLLLLSEQIAMCDEAHANLRLAASLRAENSATRQCCELGCDICEVTLSSDEVYFLHGKLVASIRHISEQFHDNAAACGIPVEEAHDKVMARAAEDVTPWGVCRTCAALHLGTMEELGNAKRVAEVYFAGGSIALSDLPQSSSLVRPDDCSQ